MMGNEKRGWIRIVEAFVSILLIAGAVLVLMNEGYIAKTDISQKVYDAELSILRDIELDETLRTEVLEFEDDLYVQAVGITANLQIYNPRQIKLFCWTD